MTAYERAEGWSEPQSKGGQSEPQSPARAKKEKRPTVLARLPNLNVAELDRVVDDEPKPSEGRSLRHRASMAVLIGVGTLFVVVAVQPYVMRKGERGMQPPAPTASTAPAWNASAARDDGPAAPAGQDSKQPSLPPIPVSIPALPPMVPPVPSDLEGPANLGPSLGPDKQSNLNPGRTPVTSSGPAILERPASDEHRFGLTAARAEPALRAPIVEPVTQQPGPAVPVGGPVPLPASMMSSTSSQTLPGSALSEADYGRSGIAPTVGYGGQQLPDHRLAQNPLANVPSYPVTPAVGYAPNATLPSYYGAPVPTQAAANQAMVLRADGASPAPSYPASGYGIPSYPAGYAAQPAYGVYSAAPGGVAVPTPCAVPSAEPGVARFQGVIDPSMQRPTNVPARPGLY